MLKPGGRLLASFFLLNEDTQLRLAGSRRHVLGEEQRDGGIPYRSSDPETPEHMIVVFERDVREMYAGAGLEIESIRYGKWCGRRDTTSAPPGPGRGQAPVSQTTDDHRSELRPPASGELCWARCHGRDLGRRTAPQTA